jgi:hemolysin D
LAQDSHQFKPLLAEIEDEPLSPLGRITFWIVITILVFAIGWLYFGKVDIVISAQGRIIPEGNVKIIQPLDTGVIRSILVKEGQFVHKGQVLLEIDPSTTQPSLASLEEMHQYNELEKVRIQSSLSNNSFGPGHSPSNWGKSRTQETMHAESQASLNGQIQAKEQELKQVTSQFETAKSDQSQYTNLLEITREKQRRLEPVKDILPRQDIEQVAESLLNYTGRLNEATNRLKELEHKKAQIEDEIAYIKANFRTNLLHELSDKEKNVIDLGSKIQEMRFKNTKQTLVSPVDGYIDEVFIHTVGGVVTPAEKIISIVPKDSPLVVESIVLNKDIGFIHSGLSTAIKVDTYDFQKYGTLPGVVTQISNDSHKDEKLGPVFKVIVDLKKRDLLVDGHLTQIAPGMSVITEIKVGKRRIIEFFIYPLIKSLKESVSVQ